MKELNLNTLCIRLNRAIEIAKVGNFKLCIMFDRSYENAYDDYKLIKNYYMPIFSNFVSVLESDMIVEVQSDYSYAIDGFTYETLIDLQEKINKNIPHILPEITIDKTIKEFIEVTIKKSGISILRIEKVMRVAQVIAKIDSQNKVEVTHIAEALQYQIFNKNYIDLENSNLYQKGRRVGNTARLVDMFIQDFFNKGECQCQIYDHYNTRRSKLRVFELVLQRLNREHGIEKQDVILDWNNFIIRKK